MKSGNSVIKVSIPLIRNKKVKGYDIAESVKDYKKEIEKHFKL